MSDLDLSTIPDRVLRDLLEAAWRPVPKLFPGVGIGGLEYRGAIQIVTQDGFRFAVEATGGTPRDVAEQFLRFQQSVRAHLELSHRGLTRAEDAG